MCDLNNYFKFQNFTIRDTVENDVAELVPLINEAYSYIEAIRKKPRTSETDLLEKFQENDFKLIFNKNGIAGCFCIKIHDSSMYFGMFTLGPVYRGTGLGKEILKTIELYAKTMKIKVIEIDRMSVSPWLKNITKTKGLLKQALLKNGAKLTAFKCINKFISFLNISGIHLLTPAKKKKESRLYLGDLFFEKIVS